MEKLILIENLVLICRMKSILLKNDEFDIGEHIKNLKAA